jgi:hypothetical protein
MNEAKTPDSVADVRLWLSSRYKMLSYRVALHRNAKEKNTPIVTCVLSGSKGKSGEHIID